MIESAFEQKKRRNLERIIKASIRYINSTPELLSILYDMDLLPEQLQRGTHDYKRMLILTYWYHKIRRTRKGFGK